MSNKPRREKVNIIGKNIKKLKVTDDYISEKDFTNAKISKDKVLFYAEPTADDYIFGKEETKGKFKQPDIIGKPFRTVIRGKTSSD